MIKSIIDFFVKQKFAALFITLILVVWGGYSLMNLSVNAVPDISNNQVRVITVSPDLAAEEVEKFITFPVEMEMANLPGVKKLRSTSKFGLSVVTIIFDEDKGMYLPRQLVKEKIASAKEKIPEGLGEPTMGPIISGLGEIYQYIVDTKPGYDSVYSPMDLRTIQDWIIRRQLSGIEGVVEINSWGGFLKQYEVAVDPDQLKSKDLTIGEVYKALKENNANTGGAYIEKAGSAYFIRGEGLVSSYEDLENTLIKKKDGNPIQIGDVAEVRNGHATRLGAVTYNGRGEAVAGQVMMLKGENSIDVIEKVKNRVKEVRKSLPEGVEIEPYYDRSELIGRTTGTIQENLTLGGLIVIFVLVLLLGEMRSGLIVATVIPLSMLFALGMMNLFGITANLLSLGAIDFGIIIDGAVIIVEYVVYQIFMRQERLRQLTGKEFRREMDETVIYASSRMMRTAFFGQVIILIVFIPILTLTGIEGKMFIPMALAFMFALLGAMILCLTYVPAVSSFFLKPRKKEKKNIADHIMNGIQGVYLPTSRFALRRKALVIGTAVLAFGVAVFGFSRMGGEFVPQLDEGSLVVHPILKPGTSLNETIETVTKLEKVLMKEFPEVKQVATRIGSAEIPADPMSLEMSDMMVILKPQSEWESAETKQELIHQMEKEMSIYPGINFSFSQPIEMLFSQFLTGSKGDIAVKIFGNDLQVLAEKGEKAGRLIESVPGVSSLNVEKVLGLPQIRVKYDRQKLAEYGLTIDKVNQVLNAGFSGSKAGTVYEGEKRFDLVVRLQKENRESIEDIKNLYVELPDGGQVPLKEVAGITYDSGPSQISRENTQRRLVVAVNTGERDIQSIVHDIKKKLDEELDLPPGYHLDYGGDFKNLQKARAHLAWVLPVALGLIFILLYLTFDSLRNSLLVFTAIPLAAVGGVLSLWIRGMPFSISAGVGFIALFGIAVLNGIVLISFFEELKKEGYANVHDRVMEGAKLRLRPVLLTALTDALGFLPMAVSTSAGAEVQRPLATVVAGGLITSTLLTLVFLPVIYSLFEKPASENNGNGGKVKPAVATFLLLLGVPFLANAQDDKQTLTPEEAVEVAVQNHPMLRKAELSVEQRRSRQKANPDLPRTQVFIGREEWEFGEDLSGVQSIGISQQLELPMEYIAESKYRKKVTDLADRSFTQQKAWLKRKVNIAYYEVAHKKTIADLYDRLMEVYGKMEKAASSKYETGAIGLLEKTSLEARFREVKARKAEMEAERKVALKDLQRWMGVGDTFSFEVGAITPMDMKFPSESAFRGAPGMAIYEQQVKVAEANEKRVKTSIWPGLKLNYRNQQVRGLDGFYAYQLGLLIPLDLWSYKGKVGAAKIGVEKAQAGYEEYQHEVSSRYEMYRQHFLKFKEQLEFFRDGGRLEQARILMNTASKRYKAGSIDYVEYARVMDQAIKIRKEYLDVLLNYNSSIIKTNYIIGQS